VRRVSGFWGKLRVVAGADALYADQATTLRNAVTAAVEDVNR
jgi:hypothetical protein